MTLLENLMRLIEIYRLSLWELIVGLICSVMGHTQHMNFLVTKFRYYKFQILQSDFFGMKWDYNNYIIRILFG